MASTFPIAADRGVITACDASYFPGFQLLFRSLKGFPVTLFDVGLTDAQRAWCADRGIPVRTIVLEMPASVRGWQAWNKPLYCEASPYERTLWLDADCVTRGPLQPIFDFVGERPFIMRHWMEEYPKPNDARLYERFPVSSRFPTKRLLNAGVIGIRKSRDLSAPWFRAWRGMVTSAAADTDLQKWVTFWDEGALIWALEATSSTDLVTDRPEWNRYMPPQGRGGVRELMRAMQEPTEDVVQHLGFHPKVWAVHPPADGVLTDDDLAPFDLGAYPQVWRLPAWSVDRRHIYWLYDILASGPIKTALEIGCLHGATSTAFVEAINAGRLEHATFCDIDIRQELRQTVAKCIHPERTRVVECDSVVLLDEGRPYDLVLLDGDHRLPAVTAEVERLVKMRPLCIVAHDTSAIVGRYTRCEGPAYLKQRLQTLGWLCLEDALPRAGEMTHRGLFVATADPEFYEVIRAAMAVRCDSLAPVMAPPLAPFVMQKPTPPPIAPPPASHPTCWKQLARDAMHVVRAKVRKGWLW